MSLKRAFVALQERFVSSLAVACCPTMDLVAVLTLDHHLLVHRTTSWQKLLHIKPSDVAFEMVTLAWRPDGLQLAVGCGEGDVAIFEIESGETLPERRSSSRHEHYITAMHWAQINEVESPSTGSGSRNKRCRRKVSGSLTDASSGDFTSQSKLQFRRRSSRFLAGYSDEVVGENTVLVTADAGGFIALWWMGSVLLTRIDIRTHFTDEEVQSMESMGHQRGDTSGFRIERVDLAPDLSLLFVLVVFPSCSQGGDSVDGGSQTKLHRMLTLDMTGIERINEDVALVASTIDRVHTILNRIVTTGKQMTTEWKNAMRIFELKMGLIGSLYEKYACEDPPQVDMLSVVVSGITAPALAQYFAQDIQEMSVHRMQKALFSGCDTLRTLVDEKLKCDLVDLLFLISELRAKAEQLAVVLNRTPDGQAHQVWLYLLSYDNIEFSPAAISSTSTLSSSLFKALLTKSPTHNFRADRIRGRSVGPATPRNPGASVIATASRGVLCVTLPPSRLTVLDAEDSEDEDDNENEEVGNHRDEED
ncbi:Anaphase-promoting complex subunit 4 [Phytophthora ramorum]|uniref:Anaphase-promoting complex subunit 4 n=1 Tax=Phytophthora ramorum TaxID=164328 RepID=UPI0030B5ABBA|nr:Anaphase-promoting complex subunit 4 [Phytophthora ramorum]